MTYSIRTYRKLRIIQHRKQIDEFKKNFLSLSSEQKKQVLEYMRESLNH